MVYWWKCPKMAICRENGKRRIKGVQLYFYEKKRLESLDTICTVTYQVLIVWNPRGSSHAKTSLLSTPPKQKSITTSWLLYQFAWWGSWQMVVETRECYLFFLVLEVNELFNKLFFLFHFQAWGKRGSQIQNPEKYILRNILMTVSEWHFKPKLCGTGQSSSKTSNEVYQKEKRIAQ